MKRCPHCHEAYNDSEKFCELDGHMLYADLGVSADTLSNRIGSYGDPVPNLVLTHSTQKREIWFVGTAGVLVGIVVCVGSYLLFGVLNGEPDSKQTSAPAFVAQTQNQVQPSRPPAQRAEVVATPEETATTEPEATPTPEPPRVEETQTVAAQLNQGPVSTGQRKKDLEDKAVPKTVIQMKDGTAVEVDAAWEDKQGVWYRRGGLVSFVESDRVKAITGITTAKPSAEH